MKCVRLLCSHDKIEVNVKNKDGVIYIYILNLTPLHIAVRNHDINMVNFLLSCDGINAELETNNGQTPYNLAQLSYDFQMMNVLRPYISKPSNFYFNYYYDYNYNDDYDDDYYYNGY